MSAAPMFSLTDQIVPADEKARLHAAADEALAEAEYEFYAMQADLQAALAVPLRDRAITVEQPADAAYEPPERPSLAARLNPAA
jgi:hypothetical protein